MTGLSASLLSLVERGKTSPSIGTLVAIAHAFDVHMTDLVPGALRCHGQHGGRGFRWSRKPRLGRAA